MTSQGLDNLYMHRGYLKSSRASEKPWEEADVQNLIAELTRFTNQPYFNNVKANIDWQLNPVIKDVNTRAVLLIARAKNIVEEAIAANKSPVDNKANNAAFQAKSFFGDLLNKELLSADQFRSVVQHIDWWMREHPDESIKRPKLNSVIVYRPGVASTRQQQASEPVTMATKRSSRATDNEGLWPDALPLNQARQAEGGYDNKWANAATIKLVFYLLGDPFRHLKLSELALNEAAKDVMTGVQQPDRDTYVQTVQRLLQIVKKYVDQAVQGKPGARADKNQQQIDELLRLAENPEAGDQEFRRAVLELTSRLVIPSSRRDWGTLTNFKWEKFKNLAVHPSPEGSFTDAPDPDEEQLSDLKGEDEGDDFSADQVSQHTTVSTTSTSTTRPRSSVLHDSKANEQKTQSTSTASVPPRSGDKRDPFDPRQFNKSDNDAKQNNRVSSANQRPHQTRNTDVVNDSASDSDDEKGNATAPKEDEATGVDFAVDQLSQAELEALDLGTLTSTEVTEWLQQLPGEMKENLVDMKKAAARVMSKAPGWVDKFNWVWSKVPGISPSNIIQWVMGERKRKASTSSRNTPSSTSTYATVASFHSVDNFTLEDHLQSTPSKPSPLGDLNELLILAMLFAD